MTSEVFNREFKRLQDRFEHPVKQSTSQEYYDQVKGWAEPDLTAAVQTITDDEGLFPKLKTLKEHLRKAAEARRLRTPRAERGGDEPRCGVCLDPDGLVWVRGTDAKGRPKPGLLVGRCAACRVLGYSHLPFVDAQTGQRVGT